MQAAAIPDNEPKRLSALYNLGILDSDRENIFDEIMELAASICEVPIALISLIDESRQWFKSRKGLDATETSRNVSFCAHAILQPGLFYISDTHKDPRFMDNPLVVGPPYIRFYAGAPLITREGYGLGTLCVIDKVARELSESQQYELQVLRTHVLKLLELRETSRELALANQELSAFNYTLSHDLGAPIRAIKGFSRTLIEDFAESMNKDSQDLIGRINSSAHRMEQMTCDLINFSQMSSRDLEFKRVNLSAIAEQTIDKLRLESGDRAVKVTIQKGIEVLGDAGLMRIVMENLLGNAWKYTQNISQAKISFGIREENGVHELFVKDNGVGFEMAYATKIFQPFQRLHRSADYPGNGIGLATVKRIVQKHGGDVRAHSIANQGTTIFLRLNNILKSEKKSVTKLSAVTDNIED